MQLFQTSIRFLGHNISDGRLKPIDRAIEFADRFPDEILDKNQLQRFLGSINYIGDFFKDLAKVAAPLYKRLSKNPPEWDSSCTQAVKKLKLKARELPCLNIPDPQAFKIIETDASELGYGGILKQRITDQEVLVRFTSGLWNDSQKNYSTIKKEILSIVLCVSKFQEDILNQKFLLRIDCKSAKEVLEKDVKNIASKQIFARWQAILSVFEFDIEFIKGETNSLPDFLTREFLSTPQTASLHLPQMATLTVYSLFCRSTPRSNRTAKPAYERSPTPVISKNKDKGKQVAVCTDPLYYDYIPCYSQKLSIIEPTDKAKDLADLIPLYLTQTLEYPGDSPKTRKWYEHVLEATKSVVIQHKIRDAQNLAFSTVYIHQVLTPGEWGVDLKKPRFFKESSSIFPKVYNYFDYQTAWEKVLNYQNAQRSHSWFFAPKIRKEFDLEAFPTWFQYWFAKYGLTEHILPTNVTKIFHEFSETYSSLSKPQLLFSFTFLYSIPWILSWHLKLEPLTDFDGLGMSRQFQIKWWAKFDTKPILEDWTEAKKMEYSQPTSTQAHEEEMVREVLKGLPQNLIRKYLKETDMEKATKLDHEDLSADDPFEL